MGITRVGRAWVYDFADGSKEMRDLLGGKGANVAEMTRILGADRVPAGFTITTEACVAYIEGGQSVPEGMDDEVDAALARLEAATGKTLGDPDDPLLVSVRSGARESMPGMLDTVLNLGLNDDSVDGLAERTGNERFAWDSYRRFVQMFGNVVRNIAGERFEQRIQVAKERHGATLDTDLDIAALTELTADFRDIFETETGEEFPQEPRDQLEQAIRAVFDSWSGDRAIAYRRINRIPDDWGTAVNVQQMVFGNKGATSGSGVAFSRDEVDGSPEPSGDFLVNAQGEDVVSGVRNTQDIADLRDVMPDAHATLMEILRTLEAHYKDMQDTEFTIEEGRLYMLQTRNAKRPAQAAVRFACDVVDEGLLTKAEAIATIDCEKLDALLHPTFDPTVDYAVLAKGVAASPGAAKGEIVFSAAEAVAAAAGGRDVILVRPFTEAEDVAGFYAARGILTAEGGKASHAALVARGMGRPAVTGASALDIDLDKHELRVGETLLREGDRISIEGTTGQVTIDDVPLVEPEMTAYFQRVLAWCDELRTLGIRANADTPEDARKARAFGAGGIGLCRTEHMFMAADRQPKMREMILADTTADRVAALAELLPLQQQDFEQLLEAMDGLPVTIRLLDPPLHEFLPPDEDDPRAHALREVNPMLGTRGCRLAILHPEIYEMQVRAIMRAQCAVTERLGHPPRLEVMVPLIDYERELEIIEELIFRVAREEGVAREHYLVGTMIELPRACFLADTIATHADFFSFGTNDLTQTALGFSRDDIEGRIMAPYIESKIFDRSPFETIDAPGVGQLVRMGAWLGRKAKLELKLGICGEHGGDPDSIDFFHNSGLDYVSCSPFRVPVARVAAAQAAIRRGDDGGW
ncbi:MAG: pyruvate, phosphate dikinase [Solirubrobacteraceae bacterium]|nr:pyruvate, phosphate dikinase [Solirubrobacteraceae bacterium]